MRFKLHHLHTLSEDERERLGISRDDDSGAVLEDTKTGDLYFDGGEPEDQSFGRDWSWVPPLLNKLADEAGRLRVDLDWFETRFSGTRAELEAEDAEDDTRDAAMDAMTPEESDAALREIGLDPREVEAQGFTLARFAVSLLAKTDRIAALEAELAEVETLRCEVRDLIASFRRGEDHEFVPATTLGGELLDLLTEARLTLAAERGEPEGAPSEGWRPPAKQCISWHHADWSMLADVWREADGGWVWEVWRLGIAATQPMMSGTAQTARAAMRACDAAWAAHQLNGEKP